MGEKCNHRGRFNHSRRYVEKSEILAKTHRKVKEYIILKIIKKTENSEERNEHFIKYNDEYESHYESSDDNCVAMIEVNETKEIRLQNVNIIIGNTEWNLLLDSG